MRPDILRPALLVLVACALASCGGRPVKDGAPRARVAVPDLPGDAIPRPEPPSRYGNGPVYEVFGKRYTVMPSGSGYSERGVASWYGKKFHGRLTSSREPYDMYSMTAAHKTLPLPTYVRVRNLRNDKSIIVRVNDRGPFVHNRIIDLSYAAALKLDMVQDGTSLVEVTAITFDDPPRGKPQPARTPAVAAAAPATIPQPSAESAPEQPAAGAVAAAPAAESKAAEPAAEHRVFAQVGAFGSRDNAERRHKELRARGIGNAFIHEDAAGEVPMYRVRIGPIVDVEAYDALVIELEALGIGEPYLVTDD